MRETMQGRNLILDLMINNDDESRILNNRLDFELPRVSFDKCTITAHQLFIEWSTEVKNFTGILSSSLVDLCPENPFQQIAFFSHEQKSSFTHWRCQYPINYKVQCTNLENSQFSLMFECSDEEDKIEKAKKVKPSNIKRIYLQLEVNGTWLQ